jgi:hypothetical protein
MEASIEKLYDIPFWPPYKVRESDLQVLSFHSGKRGYELKRCEKNEYYNRKDDGYNLYYCGDRKFITVEELKRIVNKQKEKKMPHFASQRGGLKSGDLIIGSFLKNSKAVSFSSDPMIQDNLTDAKKEASRLAQVDKTKKFVVVEVKAVASVADVTWE